MASPKSPLPEKICVACGRPYQWRRRWARDWEHVKYCSERCRRSKKSSDASAPPPTPAKPQHRPSLPDTGAVDEVHRDPTRMAQPAARTPRRTLPLRQLRHAPNQR
ncbi:MAG: DUF2256 domain-containing protein [Planctomyces sp.]